MALRRVSDAGDAESSGCTERSSERCNRVANCSDRIRRDEFGSVEGCVAHLGMTSAIDYLRDAVLGGGVADAR